ncbi:class I SAM-dependent methyltransferase [Actinoallomurus iriomotensis]|uniref:Methyltransferase n=1 Tax=Actinoallomurus iriomotensis TaxID=478107 RepID=A0A9W6SBM4_9ACTN|nr:class I SAM-dependent methyltransferase [Actinoallomurus iriomotensis]GLY89567.1 methyltransferase [Actinoallomurus iriomotensis]
MAEEYWNHNVHYHPLVLRAVPEGCDAALDIGCGDGLLARRLARRSDTVVGVDVSAEMVRLARERGEGLDNVTFAEADFLHLDDEPLGEGRFDFVSAVAVIHHVDFAPALAAVERLLAPGGRAMIVGLARNGTPLDWILSGAGVPAASWHRRRNGGKTQPDGLPMKDPAMSWGEIRRDAQRLLPGCRFRRHLLWRYSLTWDKPRST